MMRCLAFFVFVFFRCFVVCLGCDGLPFLFGNPWVLCLSTFLALSAQFQILRGNSAHQNSKLLSPFCFFSHPQSKKKKKKKKSLLPLSGKSEKTKQAHTPHTNLSLSLFALASLSLSLKLKRRKASLVLVVAGSVDCLVLFPAFSLFCVVVVCTFRGPLFLQG